MEKKLMSLGDLFKETWQLFQQGFWKLLAIVAISLGASFGALIIFIAISIPVIISKFGHLKLPKIEGSPFSASVVSAVMNFTTSFGPLLILGLLAILALMVISAWGNATGLIAVRDIRKGISIKSALKEGWKKFPAYLWIQLLMGLAVLGGFILLLIPGIMAAVWFSFSLYVFIIEGEKGTKALASSRALVKGYWWAVLGRSLLLGLIGFASSFVSFFMPGLGVVVSLGLGIFAAVYLFMIYEDLKRLKTRESFSKKDKEIFGACPIKSLETPEAPVRVKSESD